VECIEKISIGGFLCCQGNHDKAVATVETDWFNEDAQEAIRVNRNMLGPAHLRWLGGLPTGLSLDLGGLRVAVFHGSPMRPLTSYVFPDDAKAQADGLLWSTRADILVLGHTHIPYLVETRRGKVVNPGSVGQPRDGDPRASYAILDTDSGTVEHHRVDYPIDEVAAEIDRLGIPHRFASRLYRGN
jgi:putative phosphoesterase